MINPSAVSAHGKRFLYASVEDAGRMIDGKGSHLLVMLFVKSCPLVPSYMPFLQ